VLVLEKLVLVVADDDQGVELSRTIWDLRRFIAPTPSLL